ncbi:MAG: 3'(2'),5'-bisphosphate nucleotidase CysQ [Hyphomonas sp.]
MQAAERTLEEDLKLMLLLTKQAGGIARRWRYNAQPGSAWEKADGRGPVTEADLAINQLFENELRAARPEYGWLSEETRDDPNERNRSRVWVVDPIDGTRDFINGGPDWCISIALVEDGEPIAAAINAPDHEVDFRAWKGGGFFSNGCPVNVENRPPDTGRLRLIANENAGYETAWPDVWPKVELARPKPNPTLLRLAFVAVGQWDAALVLGEKADWDVAAGALMVTEAGGEVTTHLGQKLLFNQPVPAQPSVVASRNGMHPLLLRRAGVVKLPDPQARAPKTPPDATEP